MGNTKIEWAEKVWNPVTGCKKISPGCQNCYAERMANRLQGRCGYPLEEPFRVTLHPERLDEPLRWRKPSMVFVCSMGDLFHEGISESFISSVFYAMQVARQHAFLVLTKRPARMAEFLDRWTHCDHAHPDYAWFLGAGCNSGRPYGYGHYRVEGKRRPPLSNIWLGVTAENQEMADLRIPILLSIPAAVRFVSIEPMLGPVDLTQINLGNNVLINALTGDCTSYHPYGGAKTVKDSWGKLDWVIVGGESGPKARPMHPDWVRSLRDQCQAAGVPYFFKQWGEWVHESQAPDILANYNPEFFFDRVNSKGFARAGKKIAGDLLDGKQYHEFPEVTR